MNCYVDHPLRSNRYTKSGGLLRNTTRNDHITSIAPHYGSMKLSCVGSGYTTMGDHMGSPGAAPFLASSCLRIVLLYILSHYERVDVLIFLHLGSAVTYIDRGYVLTFFSAEWIFAFTLFFTTSLAVLLENIPY